VVGVLPLHFSGGPELNLNKRAGVPAKISTKSLPNTCTHLYQPVVLDMFCQNECSGAYFDLSTELTFSVKKNNPITGLDRPIGFQEVEAPIFLDSRHMKVVTSALRTGCLYPLGNTPGTHSC
jgi:hypothetical protein